MTERPNCFRQHNAFKVLMACVALALTLPLVSCSSLHLGRPPVENFSERIASVSSAKSDQEKVKGLSSLAYEMDNHSVREVTDKDIDSLSRLLSDDNIDIKYWSTAILGQIGPRAHRAVPALLRELEPVRCATGDWTYDGAIRFAVQKIEGPAAPNMDCKK